MVHKHQQLTVQYIAVNKLADGKKDAAGNTTIDTGVVPVYDAATGLVTIDLSKVNSYRNAENGTAAPNVGSQIFDWSKVKFSNSQWSVNGNTLTYKPTDDEKKLITGKGLHLTIVGDIDNVDTTPDYLSDKVYLNALVSVNVRTAISKTINTSTDLDATYKSFVITENDLTSLVPEADQAKFTAVFEKAKGKIYTANNLPTGTVLPTGVTSVAVANDGTTTITFDPTANISATPVIVLPISFNDDGTVINNDDDNLPASSLTINLTLQANVLVKNVVKPDGTKQFGEGKTISAVTLGADQSDTTDKSIYTKDTGSYEDYKLYDGDATKSTTVKFATFDSEGNQSNDQLVHNYIKTLGYVWNKTGENYPHIVDNNKNSAYEGISFSQKIPADQIKGLNLDALQPVVSTNSDGITRTSTVTKEADGSLTIVTTIKASADVKQAYVTALFKDGFSNNFVLTDGDNIIDVEEQSNHLRLKKIHLLLKKQILTSVIQINQIKPITTVL